ncbi:hypothetical protein PssvBMR18_gp57 [Pseudomonas phage MR18]|nr:hypothetical protein PssvBMR18_gp57 [Pseudomonas phage MR18]
MSLVIPREYSYLLPISLCIGISIRFLFASYLWSLRLSARRFALWQGPQSLVVVRTEF